MSLLVTKWNLKQSQELIIPSPYYYSEGRGEWKDDIKDHI